MSKGKIILVGSFKSPDKGYCYATSFARCLADLGYQVMTFDIERYRCWKSWRGIKRILNYIGSYVCSLHLFFYTWWHQPHILFCIKGILVSSRALTFIKKHVPFVQLVHFYTDNPFVVWNGNSHQTVLSCFPLWDTFFIWSQLLIKPLLTAGCKRVEYLPFVVDPEVLGVDDLTSPATLSYDVCFMGSWDKKREKYLEFLAKKIPSINIGIWGNGWVENIASKHPLHKYIQGNALYGKKMASIFLSSRIVLNFLRPQNETSHNMRTIEATAVGAFLLTQRSYEQAVLLFRDEQELACFNNEHDLVEKVKYYLEHEQRRRKIAFAGQNAAKRLYIERHLSVLIDRVAQRRADEYASPSSTCNSSPP